MMHVLLLDRNERTIYSNIGAECRDCLSTCLVESEISARCGVAGRRRRGRLADNFGLAYLCTDDADLLASSKVFRRNLSLHAAMLARFSDVREELQQEARKQTKRVIHNLTSLSAHILQELYLLVPQDQFVSVGGRKQQEVIEKALNSRRAEASSAFLKILKNATAMKTEFSVFERLSSGATRQEIKPRWHEIHRVIFNIASVFFHEFQEKSVAVDIEACNIKVSIDYESFSVALYHLFQNAVKYTSHNSSLFVRFVAVRDEFVIRFSMESLRILPHEEARIFEEGYSGEIPRRLERAGGGYGMSIAKSLVELNGGRLAVFPGSSRSATKDLGYAENVFEIRLPDVQSASHKPV